MCLLENLRSHMWFTLYFYWRFMVHDTLRTLYGSWRNPKLRLQGRAESKREGEGKLRGKRVSILPGTMWQFMLKWLLVFASMCFIDCIIKYHVCHFLLLSKHLSLSHRFTFFFFFLIKAEAVGRCSADLLGPCGSCKDFVLHSAGNGWSTDMLHQEGCVIRLTFLCDRA